MFSSEAVFFFWSGCYLVEIDDVAVGFYLVACKQGKACRHNIRDEVLSLNKKVF
jgi:hypothetical protein